MIQAQIFDYLKRIYPEKFEEELKDALIENAAMKFNESMKAEVYAGMVYERMGGRFEMYDVPSEDQK